jgi:hypothetical protein
LFCGAVIWIPPSNNQPLLYYSPFAGVKKIIGKKWKKDLLGRIRTARLEKESRSPALTADRHRENLTLPR